MAGNDEAGADIVAHHLYGLFSVDCRRDPRRGRKRDGGRYEQLGCWMLCVVNNRSLRLGGTYRGKCANGAEGAKVN